MLTFDPVLQVRSLLWLLAFALSPRLNAQEIKRFNTFSYSVNEGLLQSTINDIALDKNNFCWLSFPNGIQKFDGKNFTTVPVQPGLPDDKLVLFFKCKSGDLLISHNEGISRYVVNSNRFIHIYKSGAVKNTISFIGEDDNIIYFYSSPGKITGLSSHDFTITSSTRADFPGLTSDNDYKPKFSSNIIGHKVALQSDASLCLWDLRKGKLLYSSVAFPEMSYFMLKMITENEVLYADYKTHNALKLYNFETAKTTNLYIKGKDRKLISRSIIYPWQNITLLSYNNRLFETDMQLRTINSELVNFQNQPIGGSSALARVAEDNFGNLYFTTITDGIKKLVKNNYPIKYFGTSKKEDNFILSILPDKRNNRILTGTAGSGLLVFDTMQNLVKHIRTLPGTTLSFAVNNIIKTRGGGYLVFVAGEKRVWKLKKDLSEMVGIPVLSTSAESRKGLDYFGNFLFQNEGQVVVQSQGKIFQTTFPARRVVQHEITSSYTMSGILHNNTIFTHANDELILVDTTSFKVLKKIPFKNTGNVRCFTKDNQNNILIGSNNGIFKIDSQGKIIWHLNKRNGLPDDCIYAMVFDNNGLLWCSTNKGIFRLNKDNSVLQLTKEDGLQENEFNTNTVATAPDGELFFGGVNGVSSFYPEAVNTFEEKINILFTRIKINNEDAFADTAAWNIRKIVLPHHKNLLAFDFIAMGDHNPGQYIYQYQMSGIDKEWIQNNDLQTVRYFLPPGKYVFKVSASRFLDKAARSLQEIQIIIRPPFWATWWFISAMALCIFGVLGYLIYRYIRIQYQKKLKLLEMEHTVQLERERISRDLHDSIGAYANAVLYSTELLEKEQQATLKTELMKDIRFASKDIITSLRETIWALKKQKYNAQDCLMRIRNFVQPFNRYYPHIHFTVNGEASPEINLHYTRALNIVRIVQEAVTNAIKHSGAANITINSSVHENKWRVEVSDDGRGFDEAKSAGTDRGNGLLNMKERAQETAFELSILSRPGAGTRIIITV